MRRTPSQLASLLVAAAVLAAAAAGCGSEGEDAQADASVEELCGAGGGGDEAFPIEVGADSAPEFAALQDGDSLTLTLGPQGYYMITLDVRASLGLSTDSVCFECASEAESTTGAFDHRMPAGAKTFEQVVGDTFESGDLIVLGGDPSMYDNTDATVRMTCTGHGLSGSVERILHLLAPVQ
jgi:hypothetical protein